MDQNKLPIYPIEPWCVTETSFDLSANYRNETTFALSNGYIGTRGTLEEAYQFTEAEGLEGNFINGFYEREPIRYGEWNYGFPQLSQSLLNLPDLKAVTVTVDGETMDLRTKSPRDYRRTLHMRDAVVTRSFSYTFSSGKEIRLEMRRFVSLDRKNLMAMEYRVTPVNFSGTVTLHSRLNADVENHTRTTNPLVDYGPFGRHLEPELLYGKNTPIPTLFYQGHTKNSGLTVACGAAHVCTPPQTTPVYVTDALSASVSLSVSLKEGESFCLHKYIIYTSSLDLSTGELEAFVLHRLADAAECGYSVLEQSHSRITRDFWEHADVVVEGDDALLQGMRFNLFHIMQAAGRDGKTGMGAKGLTGEGYEGHYFWDTEMYAIPVFVFTAPHLARKLLEYRFNTLNQARERARVLGHPMGALYPWRTINGEEASTYFPLGTAQYHINGDIAYALWLYVTVTGDLDFLAKQGAEILCETARVWADVGCFAESRENRYCICAVTGPDEYNAIVDNNFYTNLIARENLRSALAALDCLKSAKPDSYKRLVEKLGLTEAETAGWNEIADHMYLPYDETRKINPLDDGFLMRKPWDDSKIPPEKRYLLYENYHPLFIYRQRMSKQADAILGMVLYSNYFTEEELKRNYDFYQEVTLHHSSLSTCIFGILACQIGYEEESYTYFSQSARMDLDDYHGNVYAGIHAANMAGTWLAIVNGFAGLRTNTGTLKLTPRCPAQWKGYRFRIQFRESLLEISVHHGEADVTLLNDTAVDFSLFGRPCRLNRKGDTAHETV